MFQEINVAYEGTYADLGSSEAAGFFDDVNHDGFDFNQLTDGFTAINSAVGGTTVSPKDIFNNADSVPPSSSFTNLTTPGSTFLDTPDDDYQTSPLFSALEQQANAEAWFSLFPDEQSAAGAQTTATALPPTPSPAALMARTVSASSATQQIIVHPGGEGNPRKRSSPSTTTLASFNNPAASSPLIKPSAVAGVNPRKRDKPLPPIVVSENDPVALKRARNTAAARKSRAKKVEEREGFEAEIADLRAQVEHWRSVALAHGAPAE